MTRSYATKKNIFYSIAIAVLLSLLQGCNGPCTEADDTGQGYSQSVETKFASKGQFDTKMPGENGYDPIYKQTLPWQETDLVTDGNPLVLEVEGMWTSWDGTDQKRICSNFKNVSINGSSCIKAVDDGPYQINDEKSGNDIKYGAPCWYDKGLNLYLLFFADYPEYKRTLTNIKLDASLTDTEKTQQTLAAEQKYHPNANMATIKNPKNPTVHLYNPTQRRFWSGDGSMKDTTGAAIQPKAGWKVFYKVADSYYADNAQSDDFKIKFISGVYKGEPTKIFSALFELITRLFKKYAQLTFTGIVQNSTFKSLVLGSASIMIVFTGIGYILGTNNISYADAIVRVLKIATVAALLGPKSWDFFYQNFLSLFVEGVAEMSGIVGSSIVSYNPDNPFGFIDYFFFVHFFSSTVWNIKIPAILTAQFAPGILWVLIIITVFLLLAYMTVYVISIYLAGMMVISFLLGLTPLFLIALLFQPLKSIFDGWLTGLIHNALQIIMLMAFLVFIFDIVKIHILKTVGFPTCRSKLVTFTPCMEGCKDSVCCPELGVIEGHHPGHSYAPFALLGGDTTKDTEETITIDGKSLKVWYDKPYKIDDTMDTIPVPPDYTEKKLRYINLPYLDPDTDKERIADVLLHGKIIDLKEAAVVLLIAVMAIFIKDTVIEVGHIVGGGEVFRDNLSATFAGFSQKMAGIGGKYNPFQMYYGAKAGLQDKVARTLRLDKVHNVVGKIVAPVAMVSPISNSSLNALKGGAISKAQKKLDAQTSIAARFQDAVGGRLEFLDKGSKRLAPQSLAKAAMDPKKSLKELYNIGNAYKDHMDGINFLRDPKIRNRILQDSINQFKESSGPEGATGNRTDAGRAPRSELSIRKQQGLPRGEERDDENIYSSIDDERVYSDDNKHDDKNIYSSIDEDNIYDAVKDDSRDQERRSALKEEINKISEQKTKRTSSDALTHAPTIRQRKSKTAGTINEGTHEIPIADIDDDESDA